MPEPKPKSLAWKLAEVGGEVGKIAKDGWNANQKYKFVKESDVSAAISPLLAERHIFLWSDEVERSEHEVFKTQNNAVMWKVMVNVAYQFIDGETGEVTPIQHRWGDGADTSDKALPKAQSMSLKYFLLKTFLLSTGTDDAEADEKVDKAAAAAGAAKGPVTVGKSAVAGAGRGGKSVHATTAQVSEIARLAGKLGLDADTIVPVIKKVIGTEPEEGQKLREWLGGLTSEQAAGIVAALAAMDEFDAEIGEVEVTVGEVVEDEPDDVPVV
jgi:hypothetical protein